jgi:hypothetical protein
MRGAVVAYGRRGRIRGACLCQPSTPRTLWGEVRLAGGGPARPRRPGRPPAGPDQRQRQRQRRRQRQRPQPPGAACPGNRTGAAGRDPLSGFENVGPWGDFPTPNTAGLPRGLSDISSPSDRPIRSGTRCPPAIRILAPSRGAAIVGVCQDVLLHAGTPRTSPRRSVKRRSSSRWPPRGWNCRRTNMRADLPREQTRCAVSSRGASPVVDGHVGPSRRINGTCWAMPVH